jgi:hypothetical protein
MTERDRGRDRHRDTYRLTLTDRDGYRGKHTDGKVYRDIHVDRERGTDTQIYYRLTERNTETDIPYS